MRDKLRERLEELAEHTHDVRFTCDIVHALARAVIEYRSALYCECLPNKLGALCVKCEIDAALAKGLGL